MVEKTLLRKSKKAKRWSYNADSSGTVLRISNQFYNVGLYCISIGAIYILRNVLSIPTTESGRGGTSCIKKNVL